MTVIDPNKVNLAEKDIEEWLWKHPQAIGVCQWTGRQVRVPSGIIDLLGADSNNPNTPVVVEVKNVDPTPAAILQVCRYSMDVERIVDSLNPAYDNSPRRVLVAKANSITNELLYEANAVDVEIRSFEVSFDLSVSGYWRFDDSKRKSDNELRQTLCQTEQFSWFEIDEEQEQEEETETEQDQADELPEAFKKYLDKSSGEETPQEE